MKMNLIKTSILTFALSLALFACKKPDDIKPEITIESPSEGQGFAQNGNLIFKAKFTDDRELSQYKVDIHGAEDGHGHQLQSDVEWVEVFVGDLSGTEQKVERNLPIPANAKTGPYHVVVKCIDKAGNERTHKDIEVLIISGGK
jgi:hypothetical protein